MLSLLTLQVGHYVVVFSRNPVSLAPVFTYSKWRPNGPMRSQSGLSERDAMIPPAVRRYEYFNLIYIKLSLLKDFKMKNLIFLLHFLLNSFRTRYCDELITYQLP